METVNYDTIAAGPELDALVIRKVMLSPPREWDKTTLNFYSAGSWSPSTNIAHAWEVVEKLPEYLELEQLATGGDEREWRAHFSSHTGRGATAPLAICRAALKAVM